MGPAFRFLLVAGLAAACSSGGPEGSSGGWSAVPTAAAPATVNCGDPIEALGPGAPGLASLDGSFPASVGRGGDGTFSGAVTLVAHQALAGVASPLADVYVVRDGLVVTVPLPTDAVGTAVRVPAGGTAVFDAVGTIAGCDGPGARLAPGRYDVYAVVTVTGDGGPGTEVVAPGGPWPLEVV